MGHSPDSTDLPRDAAPSKLVRDELFESASPEFVDYLRRFQGPKLLASFADRWKADPRPEARELIRQYAAEPLNVPGHEPVVKRLFKHAEATGDHEAVAWWAAAFDRLVRRKRANAWHWDSDRKESYTTVELRIPQNRTVPNANVLELSLWGRSPGTKGRLFTYATRHYLNRRAWRYLRSLGHADPGAYVAAVAVLLIRYRDEDLGAPEHLLDSRTLMHACFHGSDVLEFTPRYVKLRDGRSLAELQAAPYHPEHWRGVDAFEPLLGLIEETGASVVRVFGLDLIRRSHDQLVPGIDPERLLRWMSHADPRVQEFASSAFARSTRLGTLAMDVWLRLLDDPESSFLPEIVAAFEKHVDPGRLGLEDRLRLLQASPVPVASLGLRLSQERHEVQPLNRTQLGVVACMACGAVAREAAEWAIGVEAAYPTDTNGSLEFLSALFDARLLPIREAAMAALAPGSSLWNEPVLWTRLVEAPHDDVRFGLIDRLDQRGRAPGQDTSALAVVWTSVILGIQRGSRWKPRALEQIVSALAERSSDRPDDSPDDRQVDGLIAVMALAVRSIRMPERLAGLAAVARLLEEAPVLEPRVKSALPELGLDVSVPVPSGGSA